MEPNHTGFECEICNEIFEQPILLPCGKTICNKHVSDMTNTSKRIKTEVSDERKVKIHCSLCHCDHIQPIDGFEIDKSIEKLIELNSEKINFPKIVF